MVTTAHSETMTADKALAVYGKSFHWARRFLGQHMGMKAAQLYQFCRVLDDMADGDIQHGPKRLGHIRKDLLTAGTASDPLLTHFQPFLTKQKFPTKVIVALIDGLLSDQKPVRIKSDAELLSYAYHVAGTVGILMCNVLDCDDEQALGHAIDLGIAMQLTNIARDVLEDAEMGRRYLPASWVGDLAPEQIVVLAKTPNDDAAVTSHQRRFAPSDLGRCLLQKRHRRVILFAIAGAYIDCRCRACLSANWRPACTAKLSLAWRPPKHQHQHQNKMQLTRFWHIASSVSKSRTA